MFDLSSSMEKMIEDLGSEETTKRITEDSEETIEKYSSKETPI